MPVPFLRVRAGAGAEFCSAGNPADSKYLLTEVLEQSNFSSPLQSPQTRRVELREREAVRPARSSRQFLFELEDLSVACLSYLVRSDLDGSCRLCETAPYDSQPAGALPRICSWTDEEVAKIRVALRRLTAMRVRNDDDIDDLVQETLLTATVKLPNGVLEKGLLVWCMGVLRKKVGNYYRKAGRSVSLDECDGPALQRCRKESMATSPESLFLRAELKTLIGRILAEFPPQERRPVELYLAGLPACDIAQLLHPERYQNVLNRIFRGRRKLARRLARYGYAPVGRRSGSFSRGREMEDE